MRITVTVTRPKKVVDGKAVTKALEAELDATAKEASDLLAKPTANWQHKPKMRTVKGKYWRAAGTDDKIYTYVSKGTKAHTIRARNAQLLAFGPGRPKTRPNSLTPRAGKRGKATTFVKQVNHPGTAARNFDEAVAKRLQRTLKKQLQDAINKALQ